MTLKNSRLAGLLFPLVWTMFIIKGLVYVAVTPLWEGFDELFHFAYIQSLAANHALPIWNKTFISSDVAQSAAYVPLAEFMPQVTPSSEKLSYLEYWRLDERERNKLKESLAEMRADSRQMAPSPIALYQVQHPPLYYALCAPIYVAMDSLSIVDKAFAIRIFSVLLASVAVIAGALVARKEGSPLNLMLGVSIALWPCLYADIARVGNDSLGIALFSLLFLAMIRYAEEQSPGRAATLGIILALGLLTKAYFLTGVPAIVLFVGFLALFKRKNAKQVIWNGCVVLVCAVVIAGWWYFRNYHLYGTFSGLQESIYFPEVGLTERVQAALKIAWGLVLKHLFVSFCWVSGWSFLHLPRPAYFVFVILFVVAGYGIARSTFSLTKQRAELSNVMSGLVAALCLTAFFTLGVLYHEINTYATIHSMGGPGGWYFYAIVVPISFLVSFGVSGTGRKFSRYFFLVMFVAVMMLEVYGFLMVLAPYYTGIAVPTANGWGVNFVGSPTLIFSRETVTRLLANKPSALNSGTLTLLASDYLVIQGVVLWCFADATKEIPTETARD